MTINLSSYSSVPIEILVSYLPAWFAASTEDELEESTYRKVLNAFADALTRPMGAIPVYGETKWLPESTRCCPRLVWVAHAPTISDDLLIQWDFPNYIQDSTRVESQGEFLLAPYPVHAISNDGYIYLRGLAQVIETTGLDENGDVHLSYPPLVQDEPVWLWVDERWEPIHTLPGVVDWENAMLHLGMTEQGGVTVSYSAGSRATDLPITINGESVTATLHDMWNSYDEAALLVSLSRIPSEDNISLAERIKASYRLLNKSDEELTKSLVGHELGLVGMLPWDGKSTLDVGALVPGRVTYVTVLDLERTRYVKNETLVPDADSKVFTSSAAGWEPGWMLFVNGNHVTKKTYTSLDYSQIGSTGRVDFGVEVNADVTATFAAVMYTISVDPDTETATISPTPNTPHGNYTVLYVREIEAHSSLDPQFLARLLTAEGTPNELYMKIVEAATSTSPILVGRTGWGDGAHWFDDTEVRPPISYLPVPVK